MKTQTVQKKIVRATHVLDAEGQILGRLAAKIVNLLMGKHKVTFSTHQDNGDYVTIKNVNKIRVTGTKMSNVGKEYTHFSQYPGGMKRKLLRDEFEISPARVLRRAVERMLPRNKQRGERMHRLIIEGEIGTRKIW